MSYYLNPETLCIGQCLITCILRHRSLGRVLLIRQYALSRVWLPDSYVIVFWAETFYMNLGTARIRQRFITWILWHCALGRCLLPELRTAGIGQRLIGWISSNRAHEQIHITWILRHYTVGGVLLPETWASIHCAEKYYLDSRSGTLGRDILTESRAIMYWAVSYNLNSETQYTG